MIKNAWEWATARNLVYKHHINQAEYVNLDVDSFKSTTRLAKSDIKLQSSAVVKDPTFGLDSCRSFSLGAASSTFA